ncbi:hypothetical protein CPB83DRAFT_248554 [Crepidotus variabilis]|uniref:DUF221-domain-containing protein n=1 Tax=Crepidotus variabilis TaxID=179855 RepID=A0A9P6EIY8_9AGAR|nr:hypothetical protein CPB83DRAFT_248554 [Crepidotus variabilis]
MATKSSNGISSDDIKQVFKASDSVEPKAVLIQVIVMTALSGFMILAFNMLRPTNKNVYEPKTTYHAQDKQPPRISSSFFGWISPLLYNHERHLFPTLGLDAIAFLRFLHLMRWLFTATALVSCALLIPLDLGYTITNNPPQHDILSSLTIRDVQGPKLYAHIGCLYFITLLLMVLVYYHWRAMYRLRHQWLHSPEYQHAFYSRTLLVTNIPPKYRSEDGLWRIFDGMNLPYQVTSVHIGKNVGNLPQLVKEHNKNVQDLEGVLVKHSKDDPYFQERPTVKVGGVLGFGGTHEDAVKLLSHKLKQSAAAAEKYRLQLLRHEPNNYGFVSMASIPAAHGAAFDLRNEHPKGLFFELAPNPKDIFWENISLSKGERRFRTITGFILMILFCTSSLIPIFPIASIANLDALAESNAIPFLHSWVRSSPSSYALASGVIPPTIAALFNLLIPRLMRWLSKYMGANSFTTLDRVVIARYFTFMVVSQLVLFTIFGVVLNSVLEIIDAAKLQKPTLDSVLNNLNKLPARLTRTYVDQSSFWIKWFAGFIIVFDLAQITNLVFVSLKSRFVGRTPREVREWTKPPIFDYAINYSNLLFMAAVGLVFAPLAPLVPLAAAIVFWTSSWVFKYQLMYIFVTRVESGGRSWNMIINRVLFSAAFMQVIAIFTIGLQHQFESLQFLASIPPLIMTILFKQYINKRFANDFQYFLPHFEELARAIVHSEESDVVGRKLEVRYCHPALHLQTELQMPLVYPESLLLLRHNSRTGKDRHRNRSRGVDVEKARPNSLGSVVAPEELVEGVTVTPVNEVSSLSASVVTTLVLI